MFLSCSRFTRLSILRSAILKLGVSRPSSGVWAVNGADCGLFFAVHLSAGTAVRQMSKSARTRRGGTETADRKPPCRGVQTSQVKTPPNGGTESRSRTLAPSCRPTRLYEVTHITTCAEKSFQPQIPDAVASDVVLSIFWMRIGTELPTGFPRMANGKPYPSGTAYELVTALDVSKAKGVPDVYVFRKTADATLPLADAERRRQAQTQLDALEAFWSELLHPGGCGHRNWALGLPVPAGSRCRA